MNIFDIFVTYVSWGLGGKSRPVLVLEQQGAIVSIFPITTQYTNKSPSIRAQYFKIVDWRQVGLIKQSYIDTNIVLDLPTSALSDKSPIGKLTDSDIQRLINFLNNDLKTAL